MGWFKHQLEMFVSFGWVSDSNQEMTCKLSIKRDLSTKSFDFVASSMVVLGYKDYFNHLPIHVWYIYIHSVDLQVNIPCIDAMS